MALSVALVGGAAAWLLRGSSDAALPPVPAELAEAVRKAHADEAASAAVHAQSHGPGGTLVADVHALNEAEAAGTGDSTRALAKATAAAALEARHYLKDEGYRALAVRLAVEAVAAVEQGDSGREAAARVGAFRKAVLEPTGLVVAREGPARGVPGWQATAEVIYLVRLLRMASSPEEAAQRLPGSTHPADRRLTPDELRLYLRWKVTRAMRTSREGRLDALRRLILLEPGYPAAEAEAHILATSPDPGQGDTGG